MASTKVFRKGGIHEWRHENREGLRGFVAHVQKASNLMGIGAWQREKGGSKSHNLHDVLSGCRQISKLEHWPLSNNYFVNENYYNERRLELTNTMSLIGWNLIEIFTNPWFLHTITSYSWAMWGWTSSRIIRTSLLIRLDNSGVVSLLFSINLRATYFYHLD